MKLFYMKIIVGVVYFKSYVLLYLIISYIKGSAITQDNYGKRFEIETIILMLLFKFYNFLKYLSKSNIILKIN